MTPFSLAAASLPFSQHTLTRKVTLSGIGLHSGEPITCCLNPTEHNQGRFFVRTDLPGRPHIPAALTAVNPALLSTRLQQGDATVQTVEHLLAALTGLGVDNCCIELDGPEVPILDGSALPFVEAIQVVGLTDQGVPRVLARVTQPVTVWQGDAFVSAIPSTERRYTYGIDFPHSPIQQQWFSWVLALDHFCQDIAPARTFVREQDIAPARQQGLIKGGSLDNAIVSHPQGWLNALRFQNEPVRHKLIDLLGDLSLLGVALQGHILAYKAGHALHLQLARQLLDTNSLDVGASGG